MGLSKNDIKRIIKKEADIRVSDAAAKAIATLLETKAKTIAKYAVNRAGKKGRRTVTAEDVDTYRLRFGD
jgi:histone H3/H4